MLVKVTVAVPVLVTVTDLEPLDAPTSIEPNERLVGETVKGSHTPVPLNSMLSGVVLVLSVIVMAAVNTPPVVGPKCPWMLQLAPAARLVPQVFANTKDEASAPVTAMLVIVTAELPVLVAVTDCDVLADPTFSDPNAKL